MSCRILLNKLDERGLITLPPKGRRPMKGKADIFGVTYERCAVTEAGTLGAAMIAATAAGVVASYDEAVELFVKPGQVFEPDARRHAFYQEKYQYYRELYPRLKDVLAWTARAG